MVLHRNPLNIVSLPDSFFDRVVYRNDQAGSGIMALQVILQEVFRNGFARIAFRAVTIGLSTVRCAR